MGVILQGEIVIHGVFGGGSHAGNWIETQRGMRYCELQKKIKKMKRYPVN
jgi:hypothetical protein